MMRAFRISAGSSPYESAVVANSVPEVTVLAATVIAATVVARPIVAAAGVRAGARDRRSLRDQAQRGAIGAS
jgi:hypothetical protein